MPHMDPMVWQRCYLKKTRPTHRRSEPTFRYEDMHSAPHMKKISVFDDFTSDPIGASIDWYIHTIEHGPVLTPHHGTTCLLHRVGF